MNENEVVLACAITLVNQWRQGLRNNQVFELDLWQAVDKLENMESVNENWLISGKWIDE